MSSVIERFLSSASCLCPFVNKNRRNIYPGIIDSFEEYRFMRHDLQNMKYLCKDLDDGNICPACPQRLEAVVEGSESNKSVFAMDAIFGLPRKKSAGTSFRPPLFGNLFFDDQDAVDQFVQENGVVKSGVGKDDCNNFIAGNMIRSSRRYHALDETGIFGYCCRHEFPHNFINMKHGERLTYPLWILEKILALENCNVQTFVMYDIACSLSKYLQNRGRDDILDKISLCLPTFHSYGHKVSCQLNFGPRRCEGIGLSDGETMERLWSYLRSFNKMTKEMRPSHRTDVLSSALEYYGLKTKNKLASLLLQRWDKARMCRAVSEEELKEFFPGFFQDENARTQVVEWLTEERSSLFHSIKPENKFPPWKLKYVQLLQLLYELRDQVLTGRQPEVLQIESVQLTSQLEVIERKHGILQRWSQNDQDYRECLSCLSEERLKIVLVSLLKHRQKREFLLNLKKKYAEGQKIAKKLSRQISKETSSLKRLLGDYNEMSTENMTFAEALSSGTIESKLSDLGCTCASIATGSRRRVLDAYLLFSRSEEEMQMLQQELQNVSDYYNRRKTIIVAKVTELSCHDSKLSNGAVAMLSNLLRRNEQNLCQAEASFSLLQSNAEVALDSEDSDLSGDDEHDEENMMSY